MSLLSIFLAAIAALLGLRLISTALQTALSSKILVRHGLRTHWQPTARNESLKVAFRDGLLGVLLLMLSLALLT